MRKRAWLISATIAFVLALTAAPVSAAPPPCTITGTPGDDTLPGTGGDDVICGLGGNDTINGHAGDDYLAGGGGDDVLIGGTGADVSDGGSGVDTASYMDHTGSIAAVIADIDGVGDDGNAFDGNSGDNVLTNVENLIGTAGKDSLTGSAAANTFVGGLGPDTFQGLAGSDTVTYAGRGGAVTVTIDGVANDPDGDNVLTDIENLLGTDRADTLIGSSARNVLDGGEGDDTLDGRTGADLLAGNGGEDTVTYADRTSAVQVDLDGLPDDGNADDGPPGERDNVTSDTENVIGGGGGDTLVGSASANELTGLGGSDLLRGLNGNDVLSGALGNDKLFGGAHTDRLVEAGDVSFTLTNTSLTGLGTDSLTAIEQAQLTGGASANAINASAFSGPTTLAGDGGNDLVIGGSSSDNLTGGDGNDTLRAGAAADTLGGGAGNDSLTGFAGDDQLSGGPGADVLSGLGGTDTALYTERTGAVTIDIDDVADDGNSMDGPTGARDNVKTDVENLTTGSGHDALIGSAADNVFNGGTGGDTFAGLGGVDTVTYADRTARMRLRVTIDDVADDGTPVDGSFNDNVLTDVENLIGRDVLAYGRDILIGSASDNEIVGGTGADTLRGLDGNDHIVANDGFAGDTINCDGGTNPGANDVAHVDPGESAPNCETVIVVP
jgi:Ca2+-binding RTX toxin-like protein